MEAVYDPVVPAAMAVLSLVVGFKFVLHAMPLCVMALPPSDDGAAHDTWACALPGVALTPVGAPWTVGDGWAEGVTLFEGAEAGPGPTPLVAVTVKV